MLKPPNAQTKTDLVERAHARRTFKRWRTPQVVEDVIDSESGDNEDNGKEEECTKLDLSHKNGVRKKTQKICSVAGLEPRRWWGKKGTMKTAVWGKCLFFWIHKNKKKKKKRRRRKTPTKEKGENEKANGRQQKKKKIKGNHNNETKNVKPKKKKEKKEQVMSLTKM